MIRLLLILFCFPASLFSAYRERVYVFNNSDRVYVRVRKRIQFSKKYRGRYFRTFPFKKLALTEYKLGKGENLYTVASGMGISVDSIASCSGLVFIHSTKPGQILYIPDFQGLMFTARRARTVSWLAKRYRVSVRDIRRFNKFHGRILYKGQKIFLPGAHMTALEQALFYGTAFACPLPVAVLTSTFGLRRDPINGSMAFHGGLDLAAPRWTPVRAAHGGIVEFVGRAGGYGRLVVIRHAFGYRTFYGHLAAFHARRGQRIARGQLLGRVGSSGYSTGPHLHFEIRHFRKKVNPLNYAVLDHSRGGRWVSSR